ncbi:hypothetical protein V5O48_001683 [Marasmius crinis-equi]|uniref:Major facilitator superfamily (MFS) profile domain-containing protein n=1 Tax=Marasmius crinis-equi TaxID=585013 RepID=A0ABR3FXR9_9AGAR
MVHRPDTSTSSATLTPVTSKTSSTPTAAVPKTSIRFKLILCTLFISLFLAAMDLTAIATALPAMINDLHGTEGYIWVGAAYSLASTAFLPMSGGLAEIFGRQPALLLALSLFALGSALCGSAKTTSWLIAGRTVQGLGGGAIQSLASIIISDLVSLQERGKYNAVIGLAWATATSIGVLVGGALADQGQWRWLFYLNLPICGVAIVATVCVLRLPKPKGTLREKLRKMDWMDLTFTNDFSGNFLVISSTTIFTIGLSWGGAVYPWSSTHVLATLIVGFIGFVAFFVYEAKWAVNPIVPISLLSNISSVSGYIQNFINILSMISLNFYISIYLQACKDASPIRTGVSMLPVTSTVGVCIIVSGISVALTKRYRPQLWVGWVLFVVGFGLMIQLTDKSTYADAVGRVVIPMIGIGIIGAVAYFPVLAPLDVTQNAHALAFFAFGRAFAGVWAISIGNTVFQNELTKRLVHRNLSALGSLDLSDAETLYGFIPQIRFLPEPVKGVIQSDVAKSLSVFWMVLTVLGGVGLLSSLPIFMRDIPLQDVTDERWTRGAFDGDESVDEEKGISNEEIESSNGEGEVGLPKEHMGEGRPFGH